MFFETNDTAEIFDKKIDNDGLVNFKKRTWYVGESRPKFINDHVISVSTIPILVMLFSFSSFFMTLFGIYWGVMSVMMGVVVTAVLGTMKRLKPIYLVKHDYSVPLENDPKLIKKDEDRTKGLKMLEGRELAKVEKPEDRLEVKKRFSLKNEIFKMMLAPAGLWALINRDTMVTALKPKGKEILLDKMFWMILGVGLGFMGAIIVFGVNLAPLQGGV
jgi:hypothetical protein